MFSTLVSGLGHCLQPSLSDTGGHRRSFVKPEWVRVRSSLSNL